MVPTDPTRFRRILGDELRRARHRHGWTRREMVPHLDREVSIQTIQTYELGTRSMTVDRLAEFSELLGVEPGDVLTRVCERLAQETATIGTVQVDLHAAQRLSAPELTPLRRWATCRLAALNDGEPKIVRVPVSAVESLAKLCGLTVTAMANALPKPHMGFVGTTGRLQG